VLSSEGLGVWNGRDPENSGDPRRRRCRLQPHGEHHARAAPRYVLRRDAIDAFKAWIQPTNLLHRWILSVLLRGRYKVVGNDLP
jgi:hypothetical protein